MGRCKFSCNSCLVLGKATEVLKASCDTDLLLDGPWVSCELVGCSGGVAAVVGIW